ncbi:glycosyltransferase [Candidatus Reidiella endopervernicosa]|nr:glycosyltransferase [Candidatus Reidiella endopervernicosa]
MCAASIRRHTTVDDLIIIPVIRDQLLAYGLFNRPLDPLGSTQFSITRFLVPYLMGYRGVGIFFDCDMLITRDIKEMFDLFDAQYAVQVVKHDYSPKTEVKMGGLPQTTYPRKQWSSVVIYNCDHPATKQLGKQVVESASPRYLHRFEWLEDEQIGSLPLEYNYLVEEQEGSGELPFNIHHTLGAPLFRDKQRVEYADLWRDEFRLTFGREFAEHDFIT